MAIFLEDMNNIKTYFSLMVSGWVKPFTAKQLCLLFLKSRIWNFPNDPNQKFIYPVDFDPVHTNRSECV